jgi:putative exosortase-associated protein (TIGR04073 family)
MRRLLVVACLCLLAPALVWGKAYDGSAGRAYPVRIVYKFWRGVENVLGAPFEISYNSLKEGQLACAGGGNLRDQSAGLSTGLITGIGYMVARIAVGVFDIVTFPVPTAPLMDPATPDSVIELALDGPGVR